MTDPLRTRLDRLLDAFESEAARRLNDPGIEWCHEQLAAILREPPAAAPLHTHRFQDYTVCTECGETEAAIQGCHHCDEVTPGKRCWWCLRVRCAAA
jgi:hypothetical protein